MMKRCLVLLLLMSVLVLGGCRNQQQNDPENLALIPYTFVGGTEDWLVRVELREVTEEDFQQAGEIPDDLDPAHMEEGWRTVLHIDYRGEKLLQEFKFSFGDGTQWVFSGNMEQRENAQVFTDSFTLENDLGGLFYSKDAYVGGPVPPKNLDYEFEIVGRAEDGTRFHETFTLTAE